VLRIFVGVDERQPLAYSVLQHSIYQNSSKPVAMTPLMLKTLPVKRRGLTQFTYSRFIVPWLCGFRGRALFLDADMVVTGDIAKLFEVADYASSVLVNQDQARFEWASAMLFNCDNCKMLTPSFVDDEKNQLLDFAWTDHPVGSFPAEWNKAVGYTEPGPANLYHYTAGIPCHAETRGIEDGPWVAAFKDMVRTCSWNELLGNSVHAKHVYERLKRRA
jgi:hypothetical protein